MKKKLECVLLVDDNDSDNYIHKKILEKSGITNRIEIVMNGKEALDLLTAKGNCGEQKSSNFHPELIFLDINMPIMDGWEFLEEYQKLEDIQQESTVLIMLTTSINPTDKVKTEKFLKSGFFHFKPLTLDKIDEIMQQLFQEYL